MRRRPAGKHEFPQNPDPYGGEIEPLPNRLPHSVGAMSIKGFCDWADVGLSTVYKEVNSGRLKVVKVGRKSLIRMSDALAWLAALSEPDPTDRYGSPKPRRAASTSSHHGGPKS